MKETLGEVSLGEVALGYQDHVRLDKLLVTCGLVATVREARRVVQQGAVFVNEECHDDPTEVISLADGMLIQVGRFGMVRVRSVH